MFSSWKSITVAAIALTALAGEAQATMFTGGYTVTANNNDPGLVVQTQKILSDPFNLNLTPGVAHTEDLFKIWTNETSVNQDDTQNKAITTSFSFSAPPPPFGGPAMGSTDGNAFLIFQWGEVSWFNPITLNFGPNMDGILRITLSDETFNLGVFGLNHGMSHGAIVQATFLLVQDATAEVPEPGTLALLGFGLTGLVAARRRKQRA